MSKPFDTYTGGKSSSGTYQTIVNQIPPHDIFISGFAGNCALLDKMKPATTASIAIDIDTGVFEGWKKIPGIIAINDDSIKWISDFLSQCPADLLPHIFVFLDPPYLAEVRHTKKAYYKCEMLDIASHKRLVEAIKTWPVMILLSHYPCEFYDNALKGWRTVDFQGRTHKGMRDERLYMNYSDPKELHDYTFIGGNYRERELYKKMRKNMVAKFQRLSVMERKMLLADLRAAGIE